MSFIQRLCALNMHILCSLHISTVFSQFAVQDGSLFLMKSAEAFCWKSRSLKRSMLYLLLVVQMCSKFGKDMLIYCQDNGNSHGNEFLRY